MDILYRRFLLVTAAIAVMGVVTANLVIETRRTSDSNTTLPGNTISCQSQKTCFYAPNKQVLTLLAALS